MKKQSLCGTGENLLRASLLFLLSASFNYQALKNLFMADDVHQATMWAS
jgi:hypothetical protein